MDRALIDQQNPLYIALFAGTAIFWCMLRRLLRFHPAPCRRSVERFRVGAKVDVHWADENGRQRLTRAVLFDISEHGAALRCRERIDSGRQVFIRAHGLNVGASGCVCYSARRGMRRYLGIHFRGSTVRMAKGPIDVRFEPVA